MSKHRSYCYSYNRRPYPMLTLPRLAAPAGSPRMEIFWKYGLLTKPEVNMAGYWPSSRFSISWQKKKRMRPTSSHLDLVNKGFTIRVSGKFSRGMWQVVPSGQDSSILAAQVANHSVRFGSSCNCGSRSTELAI